MDYHLLTKKCDGMCDSCECPPAEFECQGNKFSPTDKQVADELADVLTYLDLLAATLGVDLGRADVLRGLCELRFEDCPHAAPHRYCAECPVKPCPIGLGKP